MNALRALRESRGWTQEELALRASLSPRTISRVEAGLPCRVKAQAKLVRSFQLAWPEERVLVFEPARSRSPSFWKARMVPRGNRVASKWREATS